MTYFKFMTELTLKAAVLVVVLASASVHAQVWPAYGGALGGGQYSGATQITPQNVHKLKPAWTYNTGDFSDGKDGTRKTTFEANPIYRDGKLFICTPYNRVVALEPETGKRVWEYEPTPKLDRNYNQQHSLICRGVSYWESGLEGRCEKRIIAPVLDGRLIAVDANDGKLCDDFGNKGTITLNTDATKNKKGEVNVTSPAVIFEDLAIIGMAIGDNQAIDMVDGTVQAFDVRTGQLRWAWDPIPQALRADAGAANAWAPLSLDPKTATIFVPTGSPSPDYWGGFRAPNLENANAVVALDARSGQKKWAQQIVRHDLFDMDAPAQPALANKSVNGRMRDAVVQVTKMGTIFVLDRETGDFLFETVNRPVPQTDVLGEYTAATQPMPVLPKPVAKQGFTEDDAWGITPIDQALCKSQMAGMRADGLYTPPSVQGSVQMPFYGGGSNWGGMAFDPVRRLIITNVMNLAQWVRLVPTDGPDNDKEGELGQQKGAPYMMRRGVLLSPFGVPCNAPPWGEISAVNIDTGELVWRVPLGRVPLPLGLETPKEWGSPNIGGPIATSTGLVFIAATTDAKIRAFNAWTGEEVWSHDIPFDGAATPMTFVSEKNGKQYLVIAAGGSALLRPVLGDAIVAFALRD
jgi:quinoprotein glucose dehydrogenase